MYLFLIDYLPDFTYLLLLDIFFYVKFPLKIFPPLIFLLGSLSLPLGALYVLQIFQIFVHCWVFAFACGFCCCICVCLVLPVLDLSCRMQALYCSVRASLSGSMRPPERMGSVVAAHRLSCPAACGILVP